MLRQSLLCVGLYMVQGMPQVLESCGVDRSSGAARQEGDSWSPDGCNNCRCLANGTPGCTRRLCQDQATWEEGRRCSEGARWEEKSGEDIRVCSCDQGAPDCRPLVIITEPLETRCVDSEDVTHGVGESWEQDKTICTCQADGLVSCSEVIIRSEAASKQCTDREGVPREVGASWAEDCNTCRCTETGIIGCTKLLCAPVDLEEFDTKSEQCVDGEGKRRQLGDLWQEACNTCRCNEGGVAGCTKQLCGPGLGLQCTDRLGETRQPGEVWTLQRAGRANQCQCTDGLVLCTAQPEPVPQLVKEDGSPTGAKVHFPGSQPEGRQAPTTKSLTASHDAFLRVLATESSAPQCKQDGVTRCREVDTDLSLLRSLHAGALVDLVEGEGVRMELRRDPQVTSSGGLSLAFHLQDGGEGNVVVAASGSMFGSIKPLEGSVHYTLESCGGGCSVIMERPADYFNQFQD